MSDELKKWEVYIIETVRGTFYTGITNRLEHRFKAHQTKVKGAKFFHLSDASKVVYREPCLNRSVASKREFEIKQLTRQQKLTLIKEMA